MWMALLAVAVIAGMWTARHAGVGRATQGLGTISIDAVPVPLNPDDRAATGIGDFHYAGGLHLTSRQTNRLHELSDLVMTAGSDRFAAVGDEGLLLEGRFLFDNAGRLIGVGDARLAVLIGEDGQPLTGDSADAEGLALLKEGDRLVSFENRPRIWLYPGAGGPPRPVPSPPMPFGSNESLEALAAAPDVADDAYMVGGEASGETWMCRVTTGCVEGPTFQKPVAFGLVSMNRLPGGMTAYLLRAYDAARGSRITLTIRRDAAIDPPAEVANVARMDLAQPMTVDNFEGMTSTPAAGGGRRFYLISDDNSRATQRTLLLAFDWLPR